MSVGLGVAGHAGPASRPSARPSQGWQLALAAAGAVAVVAAFLTWAQVVERLRAPEAIVTHGAPEAVVWSGRVFRSEGELAAWLRTRGVAYDRWVRSHPAAVSTLRENARVAAASRRSP